MSLSYFCWTVNSFMNYLLQVNTNTASSYLPVVIQIIFAAGLVAFLMFVTHLLWPRNINKLENFASH